MTEKALYTAAGWSLEEAFLRAHDQVPNRTEGHLELGLSRLVDVKVQRNGFLQSVSFVVTVEEDLTSEPWEEPPRTSE